MRCSPTFNGSTPRRARNDRRGGAARFAAAAWLAWAGAAGAAGPALLPAEQAFRLSARALDPQTLEVRFNVADGYYLYRDKLRFGVEPATVKAGAPVLPPGKLHEDEFFGKVTTYRGLAVIRLGIASARAGQQVTLVVDSQGCADAGVCYPPQLQKVALTLPAAGAGATPAVEAATAKKPYFP
ncbi:MAG: protein-disulfide reductase DsbD N-terminal domain-containing protein [Betaproteobacteria bacterium]